MSDWKIAMLSLLPIFWVQGVLWRWPLHKFRTWLAMFAASVLGMMVYSATDIPVMTYIMIDTTAGLAVLASPAGKAQKAIGFFFFCMVLFHIGFSLSGKNVVAYYDYQTKVGWMQFVTLALWSMMDAGKAIGISTGAWKPLADDSAAEGAS